MQDLGTESPREENRLEEQEQVEERFLPRRSGCKPAVPGHVRNTLGRDTGQVPADMVGNDADVAALVDQRSRLLIDPDMATAVGKIRGRRKHENAERGVSQG